MTWQDVGRAVATAAPVLAGALTGPAGAVAGAAGALLASLLGEEPDPAKLAERVSDPATLVRIREIEAEHRARLLDYQRLQTEAALANVRSARAREVALAKSGHGAAWATSLVALTVTLGFFVMLYAVLQKGEVSEAALLLLGSLGTAFGAVVNYYLGSSLGSARKDALLNPKR